MVARFPVPHAAARGWPLVCAYGRSTPVLLGLMASLTGGCTVADPVTWTDAEPQRIPTPAAWVAVAPWDSAQRVATPQVVSREAEAVAREAAVLAAVRAQLPAAPSVGVRLAPVTVETGPSVLGDADAPHDSLRCAGTLRMADSPGRGRVAVWWTRRSAGRVALLAAWRDGDPATGAWRGPIPVDTLDVGPRDARAAERGLAGCARPAPSVAVDDAQGFVHVGYAVAGPEGPGVFYAHQMDPRAGFEVPQAIVYGERPQVVRVAVAGSTVVVAYEEPNSPADRPRVAVAVSRTAGHTFEDRVVATASSVASRDPFVAVHGSTLALGWFEQASPGSAPVLRVRRARVGS